MRAENKRKRHDAIIAAAYSVLDQHGYEGTSMLKIAKAAKASNETLYRWYGDKRGLFEAMVRDNAAATKAQLDAATATETDALEALRSFAPDFLAMITSDRAIALNRAAAADATGELGAAISKAGRDQIGPLIGQLLSRLDDAQGYDLQELTTLYIGLLVGDLQIRRAIGVHPPLTETDIIARCALAERAMLHLLTLPAAGNSAQRSLPTA